MTIEDEMTLEEMLGELEKEGYTSIHFIHYETYLAVSIQKIGSDFDNKLVIEGKTFKEAAMKALEKVRENG